MRRADDETMLLARESPLELSGRDLRGADLSGLDLTGANLSYAQLDGASFRSAVMAGAILWAASAHSADFTAADLTDANLGTADLTGASLDDVILIGASLLGTVLTGTTRAGEDFTRSLMTEERAMDEIQLTDADDGRTITASPGQLVVLRLAENPSTGYRWTVPEGLVFAHDEHARAEDEAIGASGERIFTFVAPERSVDLTFALQRPWGGGMPDKTITVHVTIGT